MFVERKRDKKSFAPLHQLEFFFLSQIYILVYMEIFYIFSICLWKSFHFTPHEMNYWKEKIFKFRYVLKLLKRKAFFNFFHILKSQKPHGVFQRAHSPQVCQRNTLKCFSSFPKIVWRIFLLEKVFSCENRIFPHLCVLTANIIKRTVDCVFKKFEEK